MIQHNKPMIENEDFEGISEVLESGWIAQGNKVEVFEQAICKYLDFDGAGVAVSSGTAALYLALFSLGIGKGDEVIVPAYVCSALLNAIFFLNASPILVDVNLDDFNISFEETKKKIGKKTKAIVVPHIYGVPADINRFLGLGISVIEDCAQSIGARIEGQMAGTFGKLAIFSFYATKMLTTGQGGMIVSSNPELIDKIRDFREFDCRKEYKKRFNFQMTDIQAALGISQLRKLDSFISRRRDMAERYRRALTANNNSVSLQKAYKNTEPVYYRFVVRKRRDIRKMQSLFRENGIETIIPIQSYELLHRYLKLDRKGFSNSEELAGTTLSIPVYPSLREKDIAKIANVLKEA